jgi:hypothetical protein
MKFGITHLFTTFFLTFLFYTSYQHSKLPVLDQVPDVPGFLVPISTGKERVTSNGNRDASMYTQRVRRKAIVDGFWASGRVMKETTHTTGFTTGVVEVYSYQMYVSESAKRLKKYVLQSWMVVTQDLSIVLHILEEMLHLNYPNSLDGGNAGTNVCADAVCAAILEGGDAMAAYCRTYDGGGIVTLDAGSSDTNVCAV